MHLSVAYPEARQSYLQTFLECDATTGPEGHWVGDTMKKTSSLGIWVDFNQLEPRGGSESLWSWTAYTCAPEVSCSGYPVAWVSAGLLWSSLQLLSTPSPHSFPSSYITQRPPCSHRERDRGLFSLEGWTWWLNTHFTGWPRAWPRSKGNQTNSMMFLCWRPWGSFEPMVSGSVSDLITHSVVFVFLVFFGVVVLTLWTLSAWFVLFYHQH